MYPRVGGFEDGIRDLMLSSDDRVWCAGTKMTQYLVETQVR